MHGLLSEYFKGTELEKLPFDQKIDYIRRSSIGVPKKLVLPLTAAQNDIILNIAGNFLYCVDSNGDAANCTIRFNERIEPAHNYTKGFGFYTPFHRFYISNTAQAESELTFIYGTLAKEYLEIIDHTGVHTVAALIRSLSLVVNSMASDIEEMKEIKEGEHGTPINVSGSRWNGTLTLYTVPVGNDFKWWGFDFSSTGNAGYTQLFVTDAADVTQYILVMFNFIANAATATAHDFSVPRVIPPGWKVKILASAATCTVNNCFIYGHIDNE